MKKNAMLKIAAILMVAVLLTTCAISSTFAKYVSTDNGTAKARVAMWGVNVDVTAENAFLNNYGSGLVAASTAVIAPGTAVDSAITAVATGTPEVKTKITFNDKNGGTDFIDLGEWDITVGGTEEEYFPVVIVVNGVKYGTDDSKLTEGTGVVIKDTVEELETAINADIADTFGTAQNAGVEFTQSLTIGWYWNFNIDDVRDTALGDTAAAHEINFNMSITIEQDGPASANK